MHHSVIDDLFCPNLLLAVEICCKNEKTEELSGANLENATFANLFSSHVFAAERPKGASSNIIRI